MASRESSAVSRETTRASSQYPNANVRLPTSVSRPGIVPFRQTPAEAPGFTAIGLRQVDEGVEKRLQACIRLVEPEPAELIEHALVRDEIVTLARQSLQVEQPGVGDGKLQHMSGKLLERGRGAKIPLIAVVFLRLSPAPSSR